MVPPYRTRWIERPLSAAVSRGKVRLLLGARQTGKSRLLRRLAPADAFFVNLQEAPLRLEYERRPGLLTERLRARAGRKVHVFVDEIQKVPALLDDVQLLHDEAPGRYEFFLTGSSARRLRTGASNLLAGRAHTYRLFPVLSTEREGAGRSFVLPLPASSALGPAFPEARIEELLLWGGLPGVVLEPPARREASLAAYVEVYLEEEIRREALVRDLGAFSRFLELAAVESGHIMNLSKLSQECMVSVPTLRVFYQVLEDTFVGHWLPAYGAPGRKRVLTTPKFYFFDTGVRNAAARLPLERGILRAQAGALLEQWAVTELLHRAAYLGRVHRVFYWKTVHGAEVDAIVQTPREDVPVEAKWTEHPRAEDARHIELFLDTYPRRARRGYVVCRCRSPQQLTRRVTAIPWQSL